MYWKLTYQNIVIDSVDWGEGDKRGKVRVNSNGSYGLQKYESDPKI